MKGVDLSEIEAAVAQARAQNLTYICVSAVSAHSLASVQAYARDHAQHVQLLECHRGSSDCMIVIMRLQEQEETRYPERKVQIHKLRDWVRVQMAPEAWSALSDDTVRAMYRDLLLVRKEATCRITSFPGLTEEESAYLRHSYDDRALCANAPARNRALYYDAKSNHE